MNGSWGDLDVVRYLLAGLALGAVVAACALALFHLYRLLHHPSIGRRWLEVPVLTVGLAAFSVFWVLGLRQRVLATTAPGGARLAAHETRAPSLAQRGLVAAAKHGCFKCHSTDGTKLLGPTWYGLWGTWRTMTDGSRVFADGGYITESMEEPNVRIVDGFAPVMPSTKGLLDAGEAEAIVEFLKSLSPNGVVASERGSLIAPVTSW